MRTIRNTVSRITIPVLPLYAREPWFTFAESKIIPALVFRHGSREIFEFLETEQDITLYLSQLFQVNCWKYKHLYDLYTAAYNPIWNYDGMETRELQRDETGSLDRTHTRTGTDTNTSSGTDEVTQTGSIEHATEGSTTYSRTTFDSATDYTTDKESPDITLTDTYNSKQDSTEYGRVDTLEHDTEETTGDETESHVKERETLTRGGNQGTTTTQAMIKEELEIAELFNLIDTICLDIATAISYT